MRFNSLEAWLTWQESFHPKEIDLGLERTRQVAQRLDLLQPSATVITVAGTNGKGSCVATLEALLAQQGFSVGAYTSPHLLHYNERIRLNGEAASDAEICQAFAAIDEARGDISLSYFEFGTLAAFWLFRHHKVEYWVLEVGLGGRLDATNILDADVAVVTSIAIDHQQWLGNDRETIGREKAGIFRAGSPVVCADRQAPDSVITYARSLQCPSYFVGKEFDWQVTEHGTWALSLTVDHKPQTLALPQPQLPAPSVAAALQVLALINRLPPVSTVAGSCLALQLPGRFQQLSYAGTTVYLDVAHNPAAAEYLAMRLQEEGVKNLAVVVAMMADKDIPASLQPLLPYVSHWWVAGLPELPRAAAPEVLQAALESLGVPAEQVTVRASAGEAVKEVIRGFAGEGSGGKGTARAHFQCERLLITGSFFTVAAGLAIVEKINPGE